MVKREAEEPRVEEGAATNVVDFMALLQKSIDSKQRTPAKKSASTTKRGKPRSNARSKSDARKKAAKRS